MTSPEHQEHLRREMAKEFDLYRYPSAPTRGTRLLSPQDSCVVRGVMGGVMGGAMGVAFGVLMSAMNPPGAGMPGGMGTMPGTGAPNLLNPQMSTGPARPPPASAMPTASTVAAPVLSVRPASMTLGSTATAAAASSATAASSVTALAAARAPLIGPTPAPAPLMPPPIMSTPMDPIYGGQSAIETTSWSQVKQMARDTGRQAKGNFKTWGIMSGTFASTECLIESARGTSDIYNTLSAGCASGAILAARSGPSGMAIGCAGFAGFSYAIELFMHAS